MHMAAALNYAHLVDLLLRSGADVNSKNHVSSVLHSQFMHQWHYVFLIFILCDICTLSDTIFADKKFTELRTVVWENNLT